MSVRSQSSSLLVFAAVAAALVSGALFVLLREGDDERQTRSLELDKTYIPDAHAGPEPPVELIPPVRIEVEEGEWTAPTSVLWPVRVELDLIQADYLPTAERVQPIGTGRSARLSGRIGGSGGAGVEGEVTFVAGPNLERVLYCDAEGSFGAIDLLPGLSIVKISGPEIQGAKREVRLRQNAESLLNIGFGLLANVQGKVVDRKGVPIQGATVTFDGHRAFTGTEGDFFLTGVAGGQCVVEVEHDDYASFLQVVPVSSGRDMPAGKLTLTLEKSISMSISTPNPVGGPGPTLVYLIPASTARQRYGVGPGVKPRRFPWYELNPIEVPPSSTVVVSNLPSEAIKVLAFRPGAIAREQVVNLRPDRVTPVQIRLEAAPLLTGVISFDDKPMPGVEVTLEAPDQVRANLAFLSQPTTYLESEVMPYLPPAKQSARTNEEGRYVFTAWSNVAGVRYLEARGPASTWAGRLVQAAEERVDLALESVELGDSKLVVQFPGRTQGLPMEIVINGAPKDPYVLGPDSDLTVSSLIGGRWRMMITWDSDPVLEVRDFELEGKRTFVAALPIAAVEGQDREAWQRAGRAWPLD